MNSLVIGLGEVGTAVKEVTDSEFTFDIKDKKKPKPIQDLDVMHICFGYSEEFVKHVRSFMNIYQPKHIAIWSTVPIGVCRNIDKRAVHTPVEGVHPHLARSIRIMDRFIGYNKGSEGRFFEGYFKDLGLSTSTVSSTEATELFKLRSTARYGINLVFAQYEAELCKKTGVNYSDLMAFDQAYNKLYRELQPDYQRYVLFQPDGEIGGHCVVPNAKILNKQFPSDLLDKIIAMEVKHGN